jgi:hypothetical protein
MSVHIRGATGEFSFQINGKFNLDKEVDKNGNPVLCDERPVYFKADGSDSYIEYNLIAGSWQVKPRHARGKCVAWASISSAGSIESCNTGIWLVWNSQFKRFSQQPDVVILPASPSIEVVYGAMQEQSQDGKKKRTDDAEYVPDLNGVFDATEQLHDRRPVFRRRRSAPTKDLCEADWIEFCAAKGQWQVKRESHRGTGLGFASVSFSGPLEMCDEPKWRVWTGSKYQEQHIVITAIDLDGTHTSPPPESRVSESGLFSSLSGLLPSSVLNFFGVGRAASADDDNAAGESQAPTLAEDSTSSFGLESLVLCSRR